MASQKKKVTLYFNSAMLSETQKEALRQDRSISWIIQAAWRIARDEVKRMPSALSANANGSNGANANGANANANANGGSAQAAAGAKPPSFPRPV
jgi:uncharacterized small protein (TIGR04563 family)